MAYITLSKNSFFNNLDIIASLTSSKDKIALVLKDNAYGHGLCEMAQLAQEYGITKAVVRTEAEARVIYKYFDFILVLADMATKADEKIRYTLNDISDVAKFPKNTKIHLKVNTGMGRNGVERDEVFEAMERSDSQGLEVEAVFTHHCCADELHVKYEAQKKSFDTLKEELLQSYPHLYFHSQNSAALFREGECQGAFARVGIAAYGCLEKEAYFASVDALQPVLGVYAKRISTRVLHKGESVGYSATYEACEKTSISNYDFGYADGFLRACSNDYVTPQGVAIAGRISMDNSSFVSDAKELLVFDDAREVAKTAKTISYEILTSLKPHLKRVIG